MDSENNGVGNEQQDSLLFVDDERNILSSLRRLFRPLGYKIYVAESGKAGLELLSQHPVDLVISDMRMPEMDGAEFLGRVAQDYPDTVRILLTGFADINSTIDAINNGKIYRYLSKPWEDTEITLTVKQALQTKQLEREKLRLQKITEKQNLQLKDLNDNLEQKVKARTEEVQQTADMLDLANQELRQSYQHTMRAFANLVSMRESLSGKFSQKVADLSRAIAKFMGQEKEQIDDVYYASLLHEIGKLGLPDHLLTQPSYCLDKKDQVSFQRHPLIGQSALMAVDALHGTANLIRSQEECYDGSGFPDGLAMEQIPLGARILALARDYYGYQTGKVLKDIYSADEALERIKQQSGKRFDPAVVKVFEELLVRRKEASQGFREMKLRTDQLKPGMKLSRDLFNSSELLLLTKNRIFTSTLITKLLMVEQIEKEHFEIFVYKEAKS
ncbi:MAG: response regulator [Motiliproteus sp.]|nr:response regulator [Motiliproteus sp.]MCW9053990.1 response regulator [Motiliproteus sp.]